LLSAIDLHTRKKDLRMFKKITTGAAAAAFLVAGLGSLAPAANAREGAQSVGHGIKCYYYLGVQICYKSV
jgi:hypothetical protein